MVLTGEFAERKRNRSLETRQTTTKGITMSNCKKCHRPLHDCGACNGGRASGIFGKLTCSKCNSTGVVCNQHGGHWK